jgi:SAM-dependent methyltransferase
MELQSRTATYDWEISPRARARFGDSATLDFRQIERLAAFETWREFPTTKNPGAEFPVLSEEWFRHLSDRRYRRHGRWIPQLFGFTRHRGENLVAFGDTLGSEWRALAEQGARVTVVEPKDERRTIYLRHFHPVADMVAVVPGSFDRLPLAENRSDVVCAFFHAMPGEGLAMLAAEIDRVLRPGGKVVIALPAHYDSERYQNMLMPWRWFQSKPSAVGATKAALWDAFVGFEGLHVKKRHLRRSQLPYLWRWLPLPLTERMMGKFLILKAFKPLSAAPAIRIAV